MAGKQKHAQRSKRSAHVYKPFADFAARARIKKIKKDAKKETV